MTLFTEEHPGVETHVPPETAGFTLNHSMLRVKDPRRSLAFYSRVFGMRVLRKLDFEEMQFTLYFLARLEEEDEVPEQTCDRTIWTFNQRGLLELTHNWGTEDQADFAYHDGNSEPQGFGHICFSVPDLGSAVQWLDENGVEFVKRPEQGKMKNVAFVKDPDGYWIEILEPALMGNVGA
ncbi:MULTISPECIES: lactoylglutathione lyase [Modicisalibacter]|uniref:lactoylglutathione lyase n=1 Tax=Modicisalibacter tunisiensis TaxID=390637 RepID=A0ABS7WYX2_9GAMM|nr:MULTISPECIES: lactoylglutathione lyase [Modicisalibacter]MBZ9567066.1 lactoylglutathione lyase [Modicisalibacter tunisiensis]